MAQTPEVKVKAKIKKILANYNIYYAMPIGSGFGNAGVPDFLCCVNGLFLAIEAKAGKGTTTALQDKHIAKIRESGGAAMVVNEDNLADLESWVKKARSK